MAGVWGAIFGLPVAAVISILASYVINVQAVQEVEGVDLGTVTAAIRAAYPEATPEEVLAERPTKLRPSMPLSAREKHRIGFFLCARAWRTRPL